MRFAILSGISAMALMATPATAQEALEAQQAKPVEEQIGGGGRPVGANWSRSPVYAENGMAALKFSFTLIQG